VLNYLVHIVTSLPVSALSEFPLQNIRVFNESLALNTIPRKVGVVAGNMATMQAGRPQRSESRKRCQTTDKNCVCSTGFDPPSLHGAEGRCSDTQHTMTHKLMVVQLSKRN